MIEGEEKKLRDSEIELGMDGGLNINRIDG